MGESVKIRHKSEPRDWSGSHILSLGNICLCCEATWSNALVFSILHGAPLVPHPHEECKCRDVVSP